MKRWKKGWSIVLSLALVFGTLSMAFSASAAEEPFQYPEGVTQEKMLNAIEGLDNAILKLLAPEKNIYTNHTVGVITKAMLDILNPVLAEMGRGVSPLLFWLYSIDMPNNPFAGNEEDTVDSWKYIDLKTLDYGFPDGDEDGFYTALGYMLRPLKYFVVSMSDEQYGNELVPPGEKELEDKQRFNELSDRLMEIWAVYAKAKADGNLQMMEEKRPELLSVAKECVKIGNMLADPIFDPVLDVVKQLLHAPLSILLDLLPKLDALLSDGSMNWLINMIAPDADPKPDSLDDILNLVVDMVSGEKPIGVTFGNYDFTTLAGMTIPQRFYSVLKYLLTTLGSDENRTAIVNFFAGMPELAGQADVVKSVVDNVLGGDPDTVIASLVNLFAPDPAAPGEEVAYGEFVSTQVTYDGAWKQADYAAAATGKMDEALMDVLPGLLQGKTLTDLVATGVYTNANVNTVMKAIYPRLETMGDVLGPLGVDVTPAAVAEQLVADYPEAAAAIRNAGTWAAVDWDNVPWAFTDGSRKGFVSAVAASFRPLGGLLQFLLNGADLTLLNGAVTLPGGNGYNDGILPLLEAMGCNSALLKTAAEYDEAANGDLDALITNILTPILDLMETVTRAPIDTLTTILPNIANFIDNDGLSVCVSNLLAPVKKVIETLQPFYDVSGIIDLAGIVDMLKGEALSKLLADPITPDINGTSLPLTLKPITWAKLAGLGALEQKPTKRAEAGTVPYVAADQGATLKTLLEYVTATLAANRDALPQILLAAGLDEGKVNTILPLLDSVLANPESLFGLLGMEPAPVEPDPSDPDNPNDPMEDDKKPTDANGDPTDDNKKPTNANSNPTDDNGNGNGGASPTTGDVAASAVVLVALMAGCTFVLSRRKKH